jgi:lipopolysaccharide cholinephosphotransferase
MTIIQDHHAGHSLREIQGIQLSILLHVAEFCKRRNLKIFLFGGTLLGAVRHKGFIPWDDDIDIALKRDDYEKFLREWDGAEKNLILENKLVDPRVPHWFTKVRLLGTQVREKGNDHLDLNFGVSIDIFPLDAMACKPSISDDLLNKIFRLLTAVSMAKSGYKDFSRIYFRLLSTALTKITSYNFIVKTCRWIMTRHNEKGFTCITSYASGYGYKKHLTEQSFYDTCVKLVFEGYEFPCSSRHHEYLTQIYGETYLEIPPKSARVSHHKIVSIDIPKGVADNWNVFNKS